MRLGDARFCVWTFFGKTHEGDKFGANGLPVTPASVRILGRFQFLRTLQHKHLCKYLELQRGKYDRLFVISEFHDRRLVDVISGSELSPEDVVRAGTEICRALQYLHREGVTSNFLSLENIFVLADKSLKLGHYGLYYMTNEGRDVDFTVGDPYYLAPEALAQLILRSGCAGFCSPKSDVWALGIVLLELCCRIQLKKVWKTRQFLGIFSRIIRKAKNGSLLPQMLEALKAANVVVSSFPSPDDLLYSVVEKCLIVNPAQRPTADQLLLSEFGSGAAGIKEPSQKSLDDVFRCCNRTGDTTAQTLRELSERTATSNEWLERPMCERSIEEAFALWKLAGSSVETVLKRKGLIKSISPIKALPNVTIEECDMFGHEDNRTYLTDISLIPLSMANLQERLTSIEPERFYVSLELRDQTNADSSSRLPILVKERDIGYQLDRVVLFDRLINAYPFKKQEIWREARVDIPPLYRSFIWACLLSVRSDVALVYDRTDKETPTPTDRQIEVDIPRCHQYDELLASPTGHQKFKRILKAWVVAHPQYVYWQGLDSLSAPFLYLNFNNEPLAYASFAAFIPRYLHNFFLKDNASIIQEYLAVFSHMIAFHDPQLYTHLQNIGFMPELYAIPWFLTMFAHVFPLHKLFHLWDTLLLGDSSFPLCVGVAILLQLRDRLLTFGFNECILLFSDLPEIDIYQCVTDSVDVVCRTPKSATYRQHAPKEDRATHRHRRGGSFTQHADGTPSGDSAELGMTPIPLDQLKSTCSPSMSVEELLQLDKSGSMGPVLTVDIRPPEEYSRGTFRNSCNIPFPSSSPMPSVERLREAKDASSIVVVAGNRPQHVHKCAEDLVSQGFARVCMLHGGIDVLRRANLLTVPSIKL